MNERGRRGWSYKWHRPIHIPGEKLCSWCGEYKPFEKFRRDRYSRDGFYSTCTECIRAKNANGKRPPRLTVVNGISPRYSGRNVPKMVVAIARCGLCFGEYDARSCVWSGHYWICQKCIGIGKELLHAR